MLMQGHRVPGTSLFARRDVPTTEILRMIGPELERLYRECQHGSVPSVVKMREVMERYFFLDSGKQDTSGEVSYVSEFKERRRPAKLEANDK